METIINHERNLQKEIIKEAAIQYWGVSHYGNSAKFRDEGGFLNKVEVMEAIKFADEYFGNYKDIMEANNIKVEYVRKLAVLAINDAACERAKAISLGIIENII